MMFKLLILSTGITRLLRACDSFTDVHIYPVTIVMMMTLSVASGQGLYYSI